MKSILFASALLVAVPANALQQEVSPAAVQTPDAATLAAAERLLDAMDYNRMMNRTADAMVAQLGPTTKATLEAKLGEPVDDELISRLAVVQEKYLRAMIQDDPKIRQATALLYARHFNKADLDHLAMLQTDPVMRKWNDVAPALMGDLMPLIAGIVGQGHDAMKAELEQVVADYVAEMEAPGGS